MKQSLFFLLMLISIKSYSQVPSYVDTAGLIAWWSFTGNVIDSSGHGNNDTVYNATLTTDRFGHANCAYHFTGGTTSYIQTPISSFTTDSMTISAWAKCDTNVDNVGLVCSRSGASQVTCLGGDTNSCYFYVSTSAGSYDSHYFTGIKDTNWHFFAGVFTGDSIFLYIDDTLRSKSTQTFTPYITALFKIGLDDYSYGGVDRGYKGSIDDIGIWKKALSDTELTSLYTTVTDTMATTLVNQLEMDDVTIAPNPAQNILSISGSVTIEKVEILNLLGETVLTGKSKEIDVSGLTNGMYVLRINDTIIKKIIKD